MSGKDDIWGIGTFVSIKIPPNPSDKQIALTRNIVRHFGCSDSLKQYNIARHHYTKSLVTATTGKWISPLSKKDATTHGIQEACDSFIVNGAQMFLRTPIVPHSIAWATANSYVPGTSKFLRRNRLQERSSISAASNTL